MEFCGARNGELAAKERREHNGDKKEEFNHEISEIREREGLTTDGEEFLIFDLRFLIGEKKILKGDKGGSG